MSVLAALLAGVPPSGLGLYARDTVEPAPGGREWDFVAVNAARGDAASQAEEVKRRGCQLWLYQTPEHWQPDRWEPTLSRIMSKAATLGAVGIIVNPESAWAGADATAFARACAMAADTLRVCCASFPSWPGLDTFARACGRGVSGSVECYGRSSQDPEEWARWLAAWSTRFGGRVCLSIAGWPANDSMNDAAGFRRYLDTLPKVGGAIVWDAAGPAPTFIGDQLATYSPGGSAIGTAALAARAALAAPGVQTATAVVAVLVFLATLVKVTR